MKITMSVLLGIMTSILVLSLGMTPTLVNEVGIIADDILLPVLQSEIGMDIYAYPMTIADQTVYYAINYLIPQSNLVKKSEIYAYSTEDARQDLVYSTEFSDNEAGGISYLEWSKGNLLWVEVGESWKLVGLNLSEMESFIVSDSNASSQSTPPSFQVIDDHVYWYESNIEGEITLNAFDIEAQETNQVIADAPFYLASPYSRIPASEKDLYYLTASGDTVWFNHATEGEVMAIDTKLSTVELTAVSDTYALFADKSLDPKLYLMTLYTGIVEVVLEEVDITSVRSVVIVGDSVLLDMSQGTASAVYLWRIGGQELTKVAGETEWLRRSEDGRIFGAIPDSEINQYEHLAGVRIIKVNR